MSNPWDNDQAVNAAPWESDPEPWLNDSAVNDSAVSDGVPAREFGEARPVDVPLYESLLSGYQTGKKFISQNLGELFDETDEDRINRGVRLRELERRAEVGAPDLDVQAQIQSINDAQSVGEFIDRAWNNPEAVAAVTLQSIGMFAPVLAGTAGVGAVTGGVGSTVALAGTAGLGSFATEYAASMDEAIREAGYDSQDPRAWLQAYQDEAVISSAREKGVKRGVAIGLFDAMSAGVAGKLMAGAKPTAASIAGRGTAEVGVQASAGMGGEASAQLLDKGEIESVGSIGLEGIAEIPMSVPEQIAGYKGAMRDARAREKAVNPLDFDPQARSAHDINLAQTQARDALSPDNAQFREGSPSALDIDFQVRSVEENAGAIDAALAEAEAQQVASMTQGPIVQEADAQGVPMAAQSQPPAFDPVTGEILDVADLLDNRATDGQALMDEAYDPALDPYGRRIIELAEALEQIEAGAGEAVLERAAIQGLENDDVIAELEGLVRERSPYQAGLSLEPGTNRAGQSTPAQAERPAGAVAQPGGQRGGEPAGDLFSQPGSERGAVGVSDGSTQERGAVAGTAQAVNAIAQETPDHGAQRFKSKLAAARYRKAQGLDPQAFMLVPDGEQWKLHTPANVGTVKDSLTVDSGQIERVANEAATSPQNDLPVPTEAQKEAGNYKKGRLSINGAEIAIENPAGSKRRPEWPELKDHYGDFKRTTGAEGNPGEGVDVFINAQAEDGEIAVRDVYVVDQMNKDGSFDEHKAILGARSEMEARAIYKRNYSKDWQGGGKITRFGWAEFRAWAGDVENTKRPAADITEQEQQAEQERLDRDVEAFEDAADTRKPAADKVSDQKDKFGFPYRVVTLNSGREIKNRVFGERESLDILRAIESGDKRKVDELLPTNDHRYNFRQQEGVFHGSIQVDDRFTAPGKLHPVGVTISGAEILKNSAEPSASFSPTHETSDGTPVIATDEDGVWQDADGNEVEDEYATALDQQQAQAVDAVDSQQDQSADVVESNDRQMTKSSPDAVSEENTGVDTESDQTKNLPVESRRIEEKNGLPVEVLPANHVVMQVTNYNGQVTAYEVAPHDGSKESISKVARQLRTEADQNYEWQTEFYNMNTRTLATDENGLPAWVVSPNGKNVVAADSREASAVFGNMDAIKELYGRADEKVLLDGAERESSKAEPAKEAKDSRSAPDNKTQQQRMDEAKTHGVETPATFDDITALPHLSIYLDGKKYAVHEDRNPRGFGDSIFNTLEEAQANVELLKRKDADRSAREAEEQQRAQQEADKEQALIDSYQGFLDKKSPMQQGRIRKVLELRVSYQGRPMTRKALIESKVEGGATVYKDGDEWVLGVPSDDVYLASSTITKTGIEFARHLLSLEDIQTNPNEEADAKQEQTESTPAPAAPAEERPTIDITRSLTASIGEGGKPLDEIMIRIEDADEVLQVRASDLLAGIDQRLALINGLRGCA